MTTPATQDQVLAVLLERLGEKLTLDDVRAEMKRRGHGGNASAYRRRLNLLRSVGLVRRVRGRGSVHYTANRGYHHASRLEGQ